jgi:hypothetical protein
MPACLSHCLQFLCFRSPRPLSRSPQPNSGAHRDVAGVSRSNSPGHVLSPTSESSRPSFTLGVPVRHGHAATGTSCSSMQENTNANHAQISTGPLYGKAPGDSISEHGRASPSVPSTGVTPLKPVSRNDSLVRRPPSFYALILFNPSINRTRGCSIMGTTFL